MAKGAEDRLLVDRPHYCCDQLLVCVLVRADEHWVLGTVGTDDVMRNTAYNASHVEVFARRRRSFVREQGASVDVSFALAVQRCTTMKLHPLGLCMPTQSLAGVWQPPSGAPCYLNA